MHLAGGNENGHETVDEVNLEKCFQLSWFGESFEVKTINFEQLKN